MTNIELPTFPDTLRARTALRDLLDHAAALESAAYMTGGDCQDLVATILIIKEQIDQGTEDKQRLAVSSPPLPAGVRRRSCRTSYADIEDQLREMTDGTTEVVAYEVFDHEDAEGDVSEATAKRYGVDPGSTLGVWFLGPRELVEEYVMENFISFTEQFCAGYSGE